MTAKSKSASRVGYKRPPKDRCWKKGQSGNPSGRPPGLRNLASVLTAVLGESVRVTVDRETRDVTRLEAVTRQLVDKAAAGDPRVMQQLLAEIHKKEAKSAQPAQGLEPADRAVIEALFVRLARYAARTHPSTGSG